MIEHRIVRTYREVVVKLSTQGARYAMLVVLPGGSGEDGATTPAAFRAGVLLRNCCRMQ
jgi:hypothetical protein